MARRGFCAAFIFGIAVAAWLGGLSFLTNPSQRSARHIAAVARAVAGSTAMLGEEMDAKLRKRIRWLNTAGGFDDALKYSKIAEAAAGSSTARAMAILKKVQMKKESIENPTRFVVAAFQKIPPQLSEEMDAKLRKRIGWLNKEGGFDGALKYLEISEAAAGISTARAMAILKKVQMNKESIENPTRYVAATFRRHAQGQLSDEMDEKLRKRIEWLNKAGGFDGALRYLDIAQAAGSISTARAMARAMAILKKVQMNKESIENPTAYVVAAFQKIAQEPQLSEETDEKLRKASDD